MNSRQSIAASRRGYQRQLFAAKWCAVLLLVCGTFESFSQTDAAKTNEAKPLSTQRPQPHRYLFVVETSSSMRRRAEAVQKTVRDMLLSRMAGQLRSGDSIGIWTFNDQLHAGQFPLQRWTPENRQRIAAAAVLFLTKQSYQKGSHLTETMQQVDRVVKSSEAITVILVSSGDEKLVGTPFDAEVNGSFERDRRAQQRVQMPFVTVLRAKAGEFTDYRINLAPWPVEFPPFPPEPKMEVTEVKPSPPPPAQRVAPLIISGKKSEPVEATATPAPPSEKPAPPPAATKTEPPPAKTETSNLIAESKPAAEPVVSVGENSKARPATNGTATQNVSPPENAAPPQATQTAPGVSAYPKPQSNAAPPIASSESQSVPVAQPASAQTEAQPAANASPIQSAATPTSPFQGKVPLIIGCLLFAAAVIVWIAMRRRARAMHHASLITRSLDQKEP